MLIIGLLIALAAAVFVGVVLAEDWGGPTYAIHGFGHTLGSLTLAWIFLAGIIITAIVFVALWMAATAMRRHRATYARHRAENRAIRDQHDGVVAERDRLARELEAERAAHETAYPRHADAYGTGDRHGADVDPANVDPAYRERAVTDEETRRHTV